MQTTGVFTVHRYEIQVREINKPIYFLPFGDIHRFSSHCHVEKWKEWLDWSRKKERCYWLGMGDYDDLASTSEREILANPKLHLDTKQTIEDTYRDRTDKIAKELGFMGDRLIGLLEGNHYGILPSGITTTQLLAEKLKTKYLGANCFLRLSFCVTTGHHRADIDIFAHHGLGAARLSGGSINKVEQMMGVASSDIYLMGHDHQKSVALKSRLELAAGAGSLRLHDRKILLGRTGSFLMGYKEGEASYVVDKALNPSDLGTLKIELTPRRIRKPNDERFYIDIHASL